MSDVKRAVELDAMPDPQELLAARSQGMSWRAWVDAGKPRNKTGTAEQNRPEIASRGVRPWHPYRSKWEWQYARRLVFEQDIGLLRDWSYETERLVIGEGAVYTPDFPVTLCDGTREMREVKGYKREAAMVRIRVAAKLYPKLRFVLVTKVGGEWKHTTIGAQQ